MPVLPKMHVSKTTPPLDTDLAMGIKETHNITWPPGMLQLQNVFASSVVCFLSLQSPR